ncbi:MAG: apolipoprotein N-acyltransferase [Candidatus Eremiobacteraeota bacterium]|nr:apolipoprotein N-acyltransferase [Candidatus Eremiobacteraeota bacterium]MBC5826258.1 apolipoprotein N-acyltransferase [Candidatus Eremiobacteraeota bacterium]
MPLIPMLLLSVACPLALALSFPKANLSVFAFVGLAPLFWSWSRASWRAAFWWGWLCGCVFFGSTLYWMTNSIGDFIGGWSVLALILLAGFQGFSIGVAALLTSLCGRGRLRALTVIAAPAAWLLVETSRTRGALGQPFAQIGLVAAHVPWLLPMAAFAGVYGLTTIVALFNSALAGIIWGSFGGRRAAVAVLIALVAAVAIGDAARARIAVPPPHLRVAIAQGDVSQRVKWSPAAFERSLQTYATLTRSAAQQGAAIVVWPETAITAFPLEDASLLNELQSLAASTRTWILAGTVDRLKPDAYQNVVIALSPQRGIAGIYRKHLLVPFAEYLPLDAYLRRLPLFDRASQFVPGEGPKIINAAGAGFGTLICYESAFAPYARRTVNAGAYALLVVTDDAWFGQGAGPYQHLDMSVIDAVQTGRWVVRGADTGISEIVDPKGKPAAVLGLDRAGVVIADIGAPLSTPYLRWGSFWLVMLAGAVLLLTLAAAARAEKRSPTSGWRSRRSGS